MSRHKMWKISKRAKYEIYHQEKRLKRAICFGV
jgi:hypothetical protein